MDATTKYKEIVNSGNIQRYQGRADIRDYIKGSVSHDKAQGRMPSGYDAIWVTAIEVSAGASACFGEGVVFAAGLQGAIFTNCRTGEGFQVAFVTSTDQVGGLSIGAGGGVTVSGGYGMVPSGASDERILESYMKDQGVTFTTSLLALSGGRSVSSSWMLSGISIGIGPSRGSYFGIAGTIGGMTLIPSSIKAGGW